MTEIEKLNKMQTRIDEIWNIKLPSSEEILELCRLISDKINFIKNITEKNEAKKQNWRRLTEKFLAPNMKQYPFEIHREAAHILYADTPLNEAQIAWAKSIKNNQKTGYRRLQTDIKFTDYRAFQQFSVKERDKFWKIAIKTLNIEFRKSPEEIAKQLDSTEPIWLPGASMNIAESCFNTSSRRKAVILQRRNDTVETWSYARLLREVQAVAVGLQDIGLQKGDAVAMYMPMTPECVACYLGIVYAGCIAVSIADSLAPPEIERRIEISKAKLVITQDGVWRGDKFIKLYDNVCAADAPKAVVFACDEKLHCNLREGDLTWQKFRCYTEVDAMPCEPMDTINILFSSGTTGEPKALPWNHTTPIKCALDAMIHQDIHRSDIVAWPTNIGWMMGPWLIFATLINGATIALAEVAPNTQEFCKFVDECKVTVLGVVPSMVKKWRETEAVKKYDWSHIRVLTSTGEASNYDDYFWLTVQAHYAPIIEYCGGTEIGGAYITSTLDVPSIPSHFNTPAAGIDFVTIDDDGNPAQSGEVLLIPHSIGLSVKMLNRDHAAAYFGEMPALSPNIKTASGCVLSDTAIITDGKFLLRRHGDAIEQCGNGYFRAHGRVDDTMNLGGIKISSIEIENALNGAECVIETAAIAVAPENGGPELLVVYAVANGDIDLLEMRQKMQKAISAKLNPLFRIYDVRVVDLLPRTASNKIMRRKLRDEYAKSKK
ncbi:AMP-binding protein [Ignavibacteria bacterium]|nr:AMP-binding protein [Bacteroidota bacterium]